MSNDGYISDRSVLLVLSAPSGTGKTTLARRLVDTEPGARFSVSLTTRAPRGAEQDGVDYWFVTRERFRALIDAGACVEWAEVHGNYYGTPRSEIEAARREGRLILFDIDVQGGEQIKAQYPEAVTVSVIPPSFGELERRLRARGTDSEASIARRLAAAVGEVQRAEAYDYGIVNDDLERAFAELRSIIVAERCRSHRIDLGRLGFGRAPTP